MPPATSSEGVGVITEGDFAYVKLGFRGVFEAEVVSSGEMYELRLLHNNEEVEAPATEVWTPHDSMRVVS